MRYKKISTSLSTILLCCATSLVGLTAQAGIAVAGTTVAGTAVAGTAVPSTPRSITPEQKANMASVQVPFVANQGQVANDQVKFYAQTFAGTVFVTDNNIGYSLPKDKDSGWTVNESFVGGNVLTPAAVGSPVAPINYYIGKQQKSLLSYNEMTLGEVYNNINVNLKAYGDNVEKIFTVNPGGDPASIKLQVNGANSLNVDAQGELELTTGLGTVKMTKPVAYQVIDGQQVNVDVAYVVNGNSYGFKVGTYNLAYPLVIDPLMASTYLGGSGTDYIKAMTLDTAGNVYVTGITNSTNFPTVAGGWSSTPAGGVDVFVAKLSGDLKQLLAATYLGGSTTEYATAITMDATGNVYITGYTKSGNFPVTLKSYQDPNGSNDIFVAKLDGTHLDLTASTCFGGDDDDSANAIGLDPSGNIFVAGTSASDDLSLSGYQKTYPSNVGTGNSNGLVVKFSQDLSQVLASTYIGGSDTGDSLYAMTIDKSGNIYIGGFTSQTQDTHSPNYPTTANAFIPTFPSNKTQQQDGFVSELSNDLSQLTASTYLGGSTGNTQVRAITFDPTGNVCVTGNTQESDFPVTNGSTYVQPSSVQPETHGFVTKLKANLCGPLVASTYIGGSGTNDAPDAIAAVADGSVYIAGTTNSSDYPTSSYAYQRLFNGTGSGTANDAFVTKLNSDLTSSLASTYLGGAGTEGVYALVVNGAGNVYVGGYTLSTNLPVTQNAYQGSNAGSNDGFIAELSSDLSAAVAAPTLSSAATSTTGSSIVLTMSGALTGSTGTPTAFTISGVASNPTVTGVAVSGTTVTLALSAVVVSADVPKVSYTPSGTNDLTNGTIVAAITNQTVTNNVAATTTYAVSGNITDASSGAAISGATVAASGTGNKTTTDANGNYTLTLANGTYSLNVKMTGYQTGTTSVTVNGAAVPSQNLTLTATAATVSSATTSTNGSSIVLMMSSALTGTTGAPTAFTISGVASNPTVTGVTVSGTTVTLTLSAAVVSADVPKISYNPTGTNDLTNGTKVAAITNQAVTNNVAAGSSTSGKYTITPSIDPAYTNTKTSDGIDTMTVNSGSSGLTYFTANITPVIPHTGGEKVVFVQLRGGAQINLNATGADFNSVNSATAGFNVQAGDVVKVYIVDDLTGATNFTSTLLE